MRKEVVPLERALAEYQSALSALRRAVQEAQSALRRQDPDAVERWAEALAAETDRMSAAKLNLQRALSACGAAGLLSYREQLLRHGNGDERHRQAVEAAVRDTVWLQQEIQALRKLVAVDRAYCARLAQALGILPVPAGAQPALLDRQA